MASEYDAKIAEEEIKEFINFVDEYFPVSLIKSKRIIGVTVPALVIPEFPLGVWERLRETGNWRAIKEEYDLITKGK